MHINVKGSDSVPLMLGFIYGANDAPPVPIPSYPFQYA
jgi:hypothetical protein